MGAARHETSARADPEDEHIGDRCTDAEGHELGHAGCSITFDRYWSPVLDPYMLELGTNLGNVLVGGKDAWECHESSA